MTEGPAPGPARRGRRDPELMARLLAEQIQEETEQHTGSEVDEDGEPTHSFYAYGDVIGYKTTLTFDLLDGGEKNRSWTSYWQVSHVREDEDEEAAFERVVGTCNIRVLQAIEDAEAKLEVFREERRKARITPQSRG